MTNNYTTETFDKEHYHLGGVIYTSDYCTDYKSKNSTIIDRIISDLRHEQKMFKKYAKQEG